MGLGLLGSIVGVVTGGLQAGGAAIGARAQRKAAKKAAGFVQAGADRSNALATDIYQQDRPAFAPYAAGGTAANGQVNALLGLNGQEAATNAFSTFQQSPGYRFRLQEGMDQLNSGYAGAGVLQSGAALRGAQEYGQNYASNEYNNYLSALDNQQRLGLSAATGQSALGQSYVNTVSGNNAMAADAQANAALIRGQNNPFAAFAGSMAGMAQSAFSGGLRF